MNVVEVVEVEEGAQAFEARCLPSSRISTTRGLRPITPVCLVANNIPSDLLGDE